MTDVNRDPELADLPALSLEAGVLARYTVTADDPDGDALTFTLPDAPEGMAVDGTTGEITWRPADGQIGFHTFTVEVTDGKGGRAETREFRGQYT